MPQEETQAWLEPTGWRPSGIIFDRGAHPFLEQREWFLHATDPISLGSERHLLTPPLITTSQVPPILAPPLTYNFAVGMANAVLSSTSLVVDIPIPTLPVS